MTITQAAGSNELKDIVNHKHYGLEVLGTSNHDKEENSILKKWYLHLILAPLSISSPILIYALFFAPVYSRHIYLELSIFCMIGLAIGVGSGATFSALKFSKINRQKVVVTNILIYFISAAALCFLI